MKIPTELKHKPVIVSEEYDKIDGRLSGNTDAKGLSLGLAQWNDRGKMDTIYRGLETIIYVKVKFIVKHVVRMPRRVRR